MGAAAAAVPTGAPHVPVLLGPVVDALGGLDGKTVIDGTFGAGGYSRAFLEAGASVIGIDRDPGALAMAEPHSRLRLVEGVFGDLDSYVDALVDAVVLDVGVSSMQLDQAARGFSFMREGPLDMRMSGEGVSAADIVNRASETDLADIIFRLGECRASRRVAKAIVRARAEGPITGTLQLAEVIASCLPKPRPGQVHPATRTFQALRIAVNDELGELVRALAASERVLVPGGILAVVSFHSLEDRIVKRFFQTGAAETAGGSRHGPAKTLPPPRWERPRNAVAPDRKEVESNPRARSARLRSGVRTAAEPVELETKALGLPAVPSLGELLGRAGS